MLASARGELLPEAFDCAGRSAVLHSPLDLQGTFFGAGDGRIHFKIVNAMRVNEVKLRGGLARL